MQYNSRERGRRKRESTKLSSVLEGILWLLSFSRFPLSSYLKHIQARYASGVGGVAHYNVKTGISKEKAYGGESCGVRAKTPHIEVNRLIESLHARNSRRGSIKGCARGST